MTALCPDSSNTSPAETQNSKGSPASAAEDTIVFNVVEADSEPFEQKRYGPDKERPA